MPLLSPAAFLAVLAATVPAFAQTTWHVDASAAPPGDGIEATAIDRTAPTLFDHDADGVLTATGWIKAETVVGKAQPIL